MQDKILKALKEQGIPFILEGKNVKKGCVNIKCPWCGDRDPSFHLGIDLTHGLYGCWISSSHRGRNVVRLFKKLLDCSYQRAEEILGIDKVVLEEGDLEKLMVQLFGEVKETKVLGKVDTLEFANSFRDIKLDGITNSFYWYLYNRGFFSYTPEVIKKYSLKCDLYGDFAYRVIFPIFMEYKLISWIGRSIYPQEKLKYKDLSVEKSVKRPKYTLYNYDTIKEGGEILFIVEGVFDAIKLDFFLPVGYNSTCLFTKNMTDEQMYLISDIADGYKNIKIMLDADAEIEARKIIGELSFLKNVSFQPVIGCKDPGDMSFRQIQKLIGEAF